MNLKLFEVRDRATFIGVFAFRPESQDEAEQFLFRRSGWGVGNRGLYLGRLMPERTDSLAFDAYDFTNRTLRNAFQYIQSNFETLKSGDVIDVEFLLKETQTCKVSERLENGHSY